jgi:NAD(P)-dependent dehydrogenase (short-subunit alcohol dehydrogenase family)
VAWSALEWLKQGVRINAVCPGPTDTPLARAEQWLGGGADYREVAGIEASSPEEQASPMVFLNSDAAVAITGITLLSDVGWLGAGNTGTFPGASEMARFLFNRPLAFRT